jgi:cytochrome P450
VLTRYTDNLNGFKDPRLSSNRAAAFSAALPPAARETMAPVTSSLSLWALLIDPPDHTRIRALVNNAFTPRLVEYLRPRVQQLVDQFLDQVEKRGEMDAVAELSNPLPVAVIGDMLGLPREDGAKLKHWSDGFAAFFGTPRPTPEILGRMKTGVVEMDEYFRAQIALRRKNPGEDLLSSLLAAKEQGAQLTENEITATCSMVLFAGHETTTHLISNGISWLIRLPEQRGALLSDPVNAIEELVRYESPIQRLTRIVREDLEIGGKAIQKGQKVFLMPGAANRDESQFAKAHALDLGRKDNRHLGFGFGPHYCLGAALGRLEGQVALTTVFRRFPGLRLLAEPERLENISFRGFKALRVALA